MPTVAVLVVAAGSGTRLGHSEPKAFVELRGVSILERALTAVFDAAEAAQVVVVVPKAKLAAAESILSRAAAGAPFAVVTGGSTRQESVAAGLAALESAVEFVLVHDAARALASGQLFDRVISAVRSAQSSGQGSVGVVPVLPVSDTIKRVDQSDQVLSTVDRSDLVQVQTPQGFPRAALVNAYAAASQEFTDDAALFQDAGGAVSTVEGESRAFKITTPWDLRRAESLLDARSIRTGIGVDVHAYDDSAPLWLGGVYWPDELGLAGHSDGDVVIHAICDSLLSAAGLGDMGTRFGSDDPRFAGAQSEVFLRETLALVIGSGFAVGNVAVQVIGVRPRVAPRRGEIESLLTALVGAPVSVAATTSDGLGFNGRGEGITAIATALLTS